jgi:autotransporter-associated beta strand protein
VQVRTQTHLRRRYCARGFALLLAGAGLFEAGPASAQGLVWGGTGSTTTTSDYNLGTNWSSPPSGAPPVRSGQSAVFDATGAASVAVTSGPIAPDSWTFNANAQSYIITGAALNFSQAGSAGGIIDNADAGQTITIANSIGGSVAGVQLLGQSTLILLGSNTYTGGTTITGGCGCATLQLGDASHVASIVSDVINEGSFAIVNADTSRITSITTDGGFTGFLGSNTAGTMTLTTKSGGTTLFLENSSAGSAHIVNRSGGVVFFGTPGGADTSTAGNATIDNSNAGTIFAAFSNAGTASITNRNFGGVEFFDNASAASATIVNNCRQRRHHYQQRGQHRILRQFDRRLGAVHHQRHWCRRLFRQPRSERRRPHHGGVDRGFGLLFYRRRQHVNCRWQ